MLADGAPAYPLSSAGAMLRQNENISPKAGIARLPRRQGEFEGLLFCTPTPSLMAPNYTDIPLLQKHVSRNKPGWVFVLRACVLSLRVFAPVLLVCLHMFPRNRLYEKREAAAMLNMFESTFAPFPRGGKKQTPELQMFATKHRMKVRAPWFYVHRVVYYIWYDVLPQALDPFPFGPFSRSFEQVNSLPASRA